MDLKNIQLDTFSNEKWSSLRATHLPTGIIVNIPCEYEPSNTKKRKIAIAILEAIENINNTKE